MPGVPSNKACERCKKRHLKVYDAEAEPQIFFSDHFQCDETRPHCQRCTTAGVECPGYVQTRKFIDQGATVRRRFAPYQESHAIPSTSFNANTVCGVLLFPTATRISCCTGPFGSQTRGSSSEARRDLTFQSGYANLDPGDDTRMIESSGLPNRSAMAAPQNSVSPNAPVGFGLATPNALNIDSTGRPDDQRMMSTESESQRSEKEEFQDIFSELMTGTGHETGFLTRHYAEVLGPWLDLSDAGKFFSVYAPVRAINCLALKHAIAALSAKQLGRVKGAKLSTAGGMFTSPATTELYPNATLVDWSLKAANYYYLAISDLNKSTSTYTAISTSAILESPIEIVVRRQGSLPNQTQYCNDTAILRDTENTLATVMLLTFYRLLDLPGEEWHSHLAGIRPLYESLLKTNQMGSTIFSHGIRACFWNFARQDYLGSYLTRSATHFDPGNLSLWRAAGISIDDQEKFHIEPSGPSRLCQEDQAANGLCWLVSKVMNFLARYKQSQIAQWTGSPPSNLSGGNQEMSAETSQRSYPDTNAWLGLCFELQTWFEGVPETFRPCVRIEHPRDILSPLESGQMPFPEIFHSLATCAAGMQHYHFGRIALLLNRPTDAVSAPSTAFDLLQGYRELTKEVDYRSREICGVALGRPQGEVRIHMIPVLFAVGQILESVEERQIIVDLLRGVEADLGWATDYVVQRLQNSWNR
ncbi:uncharacterized protein N7459_000043 [Penicillium hispanicum]|uniref:uncharacterized protein n=1 Tax=Penicillium hispanicum TaxID=1080232 RepID=UPI0025420656|nr:uncharacterized protein N7459_000043 [Penicillium hispanicum]KAJ5593835.1 hypothetical protein N7459_000043 [Penicillium hispanicum]